MTNKNEVRKLRDLMNNAIYLANSQKPEPSKYGDMPPNIFTDFEKRRKKLLEESLKDY